jgi:hypothetical protein
MGQVLHGCARTTAAVRRAIQSSQESLIALAERYDIIMQAKGILICRVPANFNQTGWQPCGGLCLHGEHSPVLAFLHSLKAPISRN